MPPARSMPRRCWTGCSVACSLSIQVFGTQRLHLEWAPTSLCGPPARDQCPSQCWGWTWCSIRWSPMPASLPAPIGGLSTTTAPQAIM
eukprot:3859360-Prorocentrum_lima.AAC.1